MFIKKLMKFLKKTFIAGLLVILPFGVTVFLAIGIFKYLDSLLGNMFRAVLKIYVPGLGILATILLLFIVGLITNNVLGKKLTNIFERLFKSIPFVKALYLPIKEIVKNFSGKKSNSFRKVVFVEFPMKGSNSIGFITKESIKINGQDKVAVFIPTTPNPTNGFLVYVDANQYVELGISVDEALKTIISLGSICPDTIN